MSNYSLLRLPAVIRLTGYSRSTIYALQRQGKFPRSIKLAGGGAVAWRSIEVHAWIEAQGGQSSTERQDRTQG